MSNLTKIIFFEKHAQKLISNSGKNNVALQQTLKHNTSPLNIYSRYSFYLFPLSPGFYLRYLPDTDKHLVLTGDMHMHTIFPMEMYGRRHE